MMTLFWIAMWFVLGYVAYRIIAPFIAGKDYDDFERICALVICWMLGPIAFIIVSMGMIAWRIIRKDRPERP